MISLVLQSSSSHKSQITWHPAIRLRLDLSNLHRLTQRCSTIQLELTASSSKSRWTSASSIRRASQGSAVNGSKLPRRRSAGMWTLWCPPILKQTRVVVVAQSRLMQTITSWPRKRTHSVGTYSCTETCRLSTQCSSQLAKSEWWNKNWLISFTFF